MTGRQLVISNDGRHTRKPCRNTDNRMSVGIAHSCRMVVILVSTELGSRYWTFTVPKNLALSRVSSTISDSPRLRAMSVSLWWKCCDNVHSEPIAYYSYCRHTTKDYLIYPSGSSTAPATRSLFAGDVGQVIRVSQIINNDSLGLGYSLLSSCKLSIVVVSQQQTIPSFLYELVRCCTATLPVTKRDVRHNTVDAVSNERLTLPQWFNGSFDLLSP
jgi:hypothetical protein